jgi:hydrogenase nickel incorporation protein HypB
VAKYPTLFQPADAVVLTKMDLAELLGYDKVLVYEDLARINTRAPVFELSCRTGEGLAPWLDWIRAQAAGLR